MDRQAVENDLRRQIPSFDYQPLALQETLVATREKELGVFHPPKAPPGEEQPPTLIVRSVRPRPLLPPPHVPERDLRQRLREVQIAYRKAISLVAEVRFLHERATERLAQAQGDLTQFDMLDERIAEHDVEQLRDPSLVGLPRALQVALRDRQRAREACDRAAAAHGKVTGELAEAEGKLADARTNLNAAIAAVTVCAARKLIFELDAVEAQAHALRVRLASLQLPGIDVAPDIVRRAFVPSAPVKRDQAASRAWAAFLARLRDDANAVLDAE